jgi:hypothetical protein
MQRAHGIGASLRNSAFGLVAIAGLGLGVCVAPAAAGPGVGCNPADLAPPLGVLDLADINAFVSAFVNQSAAADLTGDGILDLGDLNLFVTSFVNGCPPAACFPDIRTTIEGAFDDPPEIQSNYDAINRTIHLFGPLPLGQLLGQPLQANLPFILGRLESLNECVPSTVDPAAIAAVLEQLAAATGPMPAGDVLVFHPGSEPFWPMLDALRDLGIGVPGQPGSPGEVAAREAALPGVVGIAGAVTVADLFFKNTTEVTEPELLALDAGKGSGLVYAAVCDNDKCCVKDGGQIPGTDRCRTETQFCNLPPPSRAFCSIASDKCP